MISMNRKDGKKRLTSKQDFRDELFNIILFTLDDVYALLLIGQLAAANVIDIPFYIFPMKVLSDGLYARMNVVVDTIIHEYRKCGKADI